MWISLVSRLQFTLNDLEGFHLFRMRDTTRDPDTELLHPDFMYAFRNNPMNTNLDLYTSNKIGGFGQYQQVWTIMITNLASSRLMVDISVQRI